MKRITPETEGYLVAIGAYARVIDAYVGRMEVNGELQDTTNPAEFEADMREGAITLYAFFENLVEASKAMEKTRDEKQDELRKGTQRSEL
jgi:hypothetical protein